MIEYEERKNVGFIIKLILSYLPVYLTKAQALITPTLVTKHFSPINKELMLAACNVRLAVTHGQTQTSLTLTTQFFYVGNERERGGWAGVCQMYR